MSENPAELTHIRLTGPHLFDVTLQNLPREAADRVLEDVMHGQPVEVTHKTLRLGLAAGTATSAVIYPASQPETIAEVDLAAQMKAPGAMQ